MLMFNRMRSVICLIVHQESSLKCFCSLLCLKGALCLLQKIAHDLNLVNCIYFPNLPEVLHRSSSEPLNLEPERILVRVPPECGI